MKDAFEAGVDTCGLLELLEAFRGIASRRQAWEWPERGDGAEGDGPASVAPPAASATTDQPTMTGYGRT